VGFVGHDSDKSGVVELNLVPFIDLMSVCIIFLLITAVWTQVSMIQLGTSIYARKTGDPATNTQEDPDSDVPFRVDVHLKGYRVIIGSNRVNIPRQGNGRYNYKSLESEIKKIKSSYPKKVTVVVTSQDQLVYKHLILAMDLLLAAGFPEISIATGEMI